MIEISITEKKSNDNKTVDDDDDESTSPGFGCFCRFINTTCRENMNDSLSSLLFFVMLLELVKPKHLSSNSHVGFKWRKSSSLSEILVLRLWYPLSFNEEMMELKRELPSLTFEFDKISFIMN